eukprot:Pompholyxophrys_punicea_v1_NODE_75_length_3730_cov_7.718912.p2 type:complete len:127 gc:universal NODE_75_length_3730_cov_7.718912:484-864(+)
MTAKDFIGKRGISFNFLCKMNIDRFSKNATCANKPSSVRMRWFKSSLNVRILKMKIGCPANYRKQGSSCWVISPNSGQKKNKIRLQLAALLFSLTSAVRVTTPTNFKNIAKCQELLKLKINLSREH